MVTKVNKIVTFFELSFNIAFADFKIKNNGSMLGIGWYLLSPLLTFLLLLLIFKDRLGSDIPQYTGYLLLGIIMFNFFEKTTTDSIISIKNNEELIKSINFNREVLILSSIIKNFFSHIFEVVLTIAFFIVFSIPLKLFAVYIIILIPYIIFIYGCSLILAPLSVILKDLENIWTFFSKLLWLGTPIFYAIENQTKLYIISQINPIYYFITITRDIILYGQFNVMHILICLTLSVLFFILGKIIFSKFKNKLSEMF